MSKLIIALGIAPLALAAAPVNAAKVIVPVGTSTPQKFFFITSDPSDLTSVTANFGATTAGKSKKFDYAFTFTLPYSGVGSGSLSTSYSSAGTYVDITKVTVDGKSYIPLPLVPGAVKGGQSLLVDDIPILANVLNTIEVFGNTGAATKTGTFAGTATFTASAVPEPATWVTFLAGFAFIGMAVRRKSSTMMTPDL